MRSQFMFVFLDCDAKDDLQRGETAIVRAWHKEPLTAPQASGVKQGDILYPSLFQSIVRYQL